MSEPNENQIIIIDAVSIPTGWDVHDWIKYTRQSKIVFHDSSNGGETPQVFNTDSETELNVIDYATEEGRKLLKDLQDGK